MIRAYQHENQWILMKNFRLAESPGGRQGSFRGKPTFDSWTGDAWSNDFAAAKRFKSREEAEVYLENNRKRLET